MRSIRALLFACVFVLGTITKLSDGILHGEKVKQEDILNSFVHFGTSADADDNFTCGGILITWKHILTAAHCGIDPDRHYAFFGTRKLHDPNALYIAELESAHPNRFYDDDNNVNPDISILSIRNPSRSKLKALGIQPIHIDWGVYSLDDGQAVQVMGFGCSTEDKKGRGCSISERLRRASGYVQSIKYCGGWEWLSYDTSRILCFNGQRGTVCGGDSGGPILMETSCEKSGRTRMSLVGIIVRVCSGSTSKCKRRASFLGVSLERYRSWIIRRVGKYRRW